MNPGRRSKLTAVLMLLCALVAWTCVSSHSAEAQNSRGTILGRVTDSSGAAIKAAKVTATNVDTNVVNSFATTGTGDYVFVNLIPGTYTVRVEVSGFKEAISSGLILDVDQTLRQDFNLAVGGVKEQMTVSADAQMVQTDNTTLGNVIDEKMVEDLPSNGRDVTNFLGLTAGAANLSGGSQQAFNSHGLNTAYGEVSLNGDRPESTSFMVDGVNDNEAFFGGIASIPNEFAVQEVKIQTGLYSAEYGQGSGQFNIAIKSGTNTWHGQLYEYLENDYFFPKSPFVAEENAING
ncbi:MAG TPA: carboxypeptidase regulatory-like domain-containing protein, partial [Terriglobia bacterium]|nr:carboxypeptidase regulatory-like domain-containing protein [Terriglobia bacterium]